MKQWEDIVKDKLEGYESPLPEGSLAEFRTRRDAVAPARKRRLPVWSMAAATALAAGLAAVLLLRQPTIPEDAIQLVPQPVAPVALDTVPADTIDMIPAIPPVAQTVTPKAVRIPAVIPQQAETVDHTEPVESLETTETTEATETTPTVPADESVAQETTDMTTLDSTPFIVICPTAKPVKMKVEPVTGLAMGGGLVAAVLTPILGKSERMTYGGPDPDGNINDAINGVSTTTHYLPVKAGLSASFALSDRLNVTTGLEYSLYLSRFKSLSETEWQQAHYIGIPVRLDYTLLSYKGLDLYLGGGMEADYCLAALRAGKDIEKDGWSFSLLGAGGVQYRFTKKLGVFMEPQITWTIPSENRVLETYRTDHPFMFSVAGGLRLFFGK